MSYAGYNPDSIPSLTGKVIFITGGTNGIGAETVLELSKHDPSHIYFTGRNATAAASVIASASSPNVTFIPCDMISLSSIRTALAVVPSTSRLDILILSAGIMAVPPGLTEDGYELQFGINHLGNAAVALHLLPAMVRTAESGADVRCVCVTSLGHGFQPAAGIDFDSLKTRQEGMRFGTWGRYGQSKLANILFAEEVGRRFAGVTAVVVHPGVVYTGLVTNVGFWNRMFVYVTTLFSRLTPRQGCYNVLWAATAAEVKGRLGEDVAFFTPVGKKNAGMGRARDGALARKLWAWTEEAVGVKLGA